MYLFKKKKKKKKKKKLLNFVNLGDTVLSHIVKTSLCLCIDINKMHS